MGIYNRDYYRESTFSDRIPEVCKYLIIANVVVFLLQIFITRPATLRDVKAVRERERQADSENKRPDKSKKPTDPQAAPPQAAPSGGKGTAEKDSVPNKDARPREKDEQSDDESEESDDAFLAIMPPVSVVQEWFELDPQKVVHGQLWRLVTYAFCHDRLGVWHIVFNMLFLFYFGRMLEPLYGSKEFLIFYLTAAVISGLCHIALGLFTHRLTPAIGASGAVMAVVVLYAILHPREKFYIFMLIPIEIRWLVIIYVIYDLHPVLLALAGTPVPTGVANAAHLGGAAFGYLYWRWGGRLEDIWDRGARRGKLLRARLAGNVRLHREPDDDYDGKSKRDELDALVDGILAKVHKHGRESLTKRERAVLQAAAERYKDEKRGEKSV